VRHRAARGGKRLDLTPKEFLLLSLLMRKSGEVLSRTFIADQVWEINFREQHEFRRRPYPPLALEGGHDFPRKLIHTVRGAGYVIEAR
jgi:two-component system copper resistance phosphate regulon response regulator CusR